MSKLEGDLGISSVKCFMLVVRKASFCPTAIPPLIVFHAVKTCVSVLAVVPRWGDV